MILCFSSQKTRVLSGVRIAGAYWDMSWARKSDHSFTWLVLSRHRTESGFLGGDLCSIMKRIKVKVGCRFERRVWSAFRDGLKDFPWEASFKKTAFHGIGGNCSWWWFCRWNFKFKKFLHLPFVRRYSKKSATSILFFKWIDKVPLYFYYYSLKSHSS